MKKLFFTSVLFVFLTSSCFFSNDSDDNSIDYSNEATKTISPNEMTDQDNIKTVEVWESQKLQDDTSDNTSVDSDTSITASWEVEASSSGSSDYTEEQAVEEVEALLDSIFKSIDEDDSSDK